MGGHLLIIPLTGAAHFHKDGVIRQLIQQPHVRAPAEGSTAAQHQQARCFEISRGDADPHNWSQFTCLFKLFFAAEDTTRLLPPRSTKCMPIADSQTDARKAENLTKLIGGRNKDLRLSML